MVSNLLSATALPPPCKLPISSLNLFYPHPLLPLILLFYKTTPPGFCIDCTLPHTLYSPHNTTFSERIVAFYQSDQHWNLQRLFRPSRSSRALCSLEPHLLRAKETHKCRQTANRTLQKSLCSSW